VTACDALLEARVDAKLSAGRVKDDVLARITVAMPKARDNAKRDAFIPETVKAASAAKARGDPVSERSTEKALMLQGGGPGVYVCDYRKYYLLEDDEWRFDALPEIMDGKNVMDFFDPDIEERLRALEEEEALLEANGAYAPEDSDEEDLDEEEMVLYDTIKERQGLAKIASREKVPSAIPRKITSRRQSESDIRGHLESYGLESDGVVEHTRGRKRTRSVSKAPEGGTHVGKLRSTSLDIGKSKRNRSQSATRGSKEGSVAPRQIGDIKKNVKTLERHLFRYAKGGESDREHYPKLVKHLNSGKRSLGTSTIGR